MLEMFLAAIVCGLIIGIFSGLLGIGGGTVMVPLLRLGFGLPALVSTATSLFTIIPTSISGFVTHIKNRTCVPKLGVVAGIAGACVSPVGVLLANMSPSWLVMLVMALIMGYSAYKMFRKACKAPREGSTIANIKKAIAQRGERSELDPKEKEALRAAHLAEMDALLPSLSAKELVKGALFGVIAGLASGYVGVGGGFIMVPLFVSFLGISMKQASGTSLIAILILAIPGTITQAFLGNVNYVVGLAMACGSIPGAFLGATLVNYIPERRLRFVFGGFLVLGGVLLTANEFGVL